MTKELQQKLISYLAKSTSPIRFARKVLEDKGWTDTTTYVECVTALNLASEIEFLLSVEERKEGKYTQIGIPGIDLESNIGEEEPKKTTKKRKKDDTEQ